MSQHQAHLHSQSPAAVLPCQTPHRCLQHHQLLLLLLLQSRMPHCLLQLVVLLLLCLLPVGTWPRRGWAAAWCLLQQATGLWTSRTAGNSSTNNNNTSSIIINSSSNDYTSAHLSDKTDCVQPLEAPGVTRGPTRAHSEAAHCSLSPLPDSYMCC